MWRCTFPCDRLRSCGVGGLSVRQPPNPGAQIRHSVQRLLSAVHDHDARTVCELLLPFGEHQPASALGTELTKLDNPAGRSQYHASIGQCVPGLAKEPQTFAAYSHGLAGVSLSAFEDSGDQATVDVPPEVADHAS